MSNEPTPILYLQVRKSGAIGARQSGVPAVQLPSTADGEIWQVQASALTSRPSTGCRFVPQGRKSGSDNRPRTITAVAETSGVYTFTCTPVN